MAFRWIAGYRRYKPAGQGPFRWTVTKRRYVSVPTKRRSFVYRNTRRRGFSIYKRSPFGGSYKSGLRYRR